LFTRPRGLGIILEREDHPALGRRKWSAFLYIDDRARRQKNGRNDKKEKSESWSLEIGSLKIPMEKLQDFFVIYDHKSTLFFC
jgi:hypothetical protein